MLDIGCWALGVGNREWTTDNGPLPSRAFTLIEVMLVLAIIAVLTAVTMPQFVRSIRGQRLRAAAQTVVMAGRYARTMAIVRQQGLRLSFGAGAGGATVTVGDELSRVLDRVEVAHVRREDTDADVTSIDYQSNGRCTPHEVRLVSEEEDALTIFVDGLGSARIETEGGR